MGVGHARTRVSGTGRHPHLWVALSLSAVATAATLSLVPAGPVAAEERVAQASSTAQEAVEYAKSQTGKPYRFGATGPAAYDCSGLVQRAYQKSGKNITRTTYTQYDEGKPVSRSNVRPGDLMFFYSGPGHVGMYVGNGKMVHAPKSGKTVQVVRLSSYYDSHFVGARRMV